MQSKETENRLFGILYLRQIQKMHFTTDKLTNQKIVQIVTRETYFFDIKIHSTQIIF